jgi:hypothetical protein
LTASLEQAEARIKAGKAIDYDPKTFKERLISIYRRGELARLFAVALQTSYRHAMPYARKVILHTPLANPSKLDSFVEACLADGVVLIAVLGPDSDKVEDLIDELVVGDASDESRFVVTSSHRNESLDEVLDFVTCYDAGAGAQIEQVRF